MQILVLNGSPKGAYSVTLQTVKYLEKCFPQHRFDVVHAGQRIKALEKDAAPVLEKLQTADLVMFSYPVYTFIAPCQLHRLIELIKGSGISLAGKFATQITTSKHFYDVTAHRYIQDNCQDLGMKYIRGLSADMDDLLTEKGRKEARSFMEYVCWAMEKDVYEPANCVREAYQPCAAVQLQHELPKRDGDVLIVTDCDRDDDQLKGMIRCFQDTLEIKSRVVNLQEYPFQGGCLGCFNCAVSGKCIYKDGFDTYLREHIQTAEAIVYAFRIKDHSMGALFKMYDDRQFCNGHRTVTMGMPVGYLISGPYARETNLQTIVEARAQVGGNFLAGVATDEQATNTQIAHLAKRLEYALENRYVPPQNFLGVGGMKVFRDLIWLMQGMMKADHQFYKKHGQYDFPQKKWGTMLKMYLVGALISSPKIKEKMGNKMNEGMLMPYKKVLDQMDSKR